MKQNTAMQELIEWVNSKTQLFVPTKGQIIEKATELLQKEQEQIKQAHIAGQKFASDNDNPDSEEYFIQTYNL